MVRSRSETNLNRIFLDLCTSPEIRSKNGHIRNNQRQRHPPLPTLTPIKSNSCSDLTKPLQNTLSPTSTSFDEQQLSPPPTPPSSTETLSLPISLARPSLTAKKSIEPASAPIIPLIPTESTGFVVQSPSYHTNTSVSLFGTALINTSVRHHGQRSIAHIKSSSLGSKTSIEQKTAPIPLLSSQIDDWRQPDYTSRLRDRLKSRGHLRKFFGLPELHQ
ncbi:hypothetical protein I4U23_030605 [Adineta vaga]|nr:hypothetical protein I4U23_030605 [Adineta vaga]